MAMQFIVAIQDARLLQSTAHLLAQLYPRARILTTTAGYTAYEMLMTAQSSVLLILSSDLQDLPVLDLLKKIHEDTISSPIIMLLTKPSETELRFQAMELGVDDILLLPYSPEYFYLRISRLRRFHTLHNQNQQLKSELSHLREVVKNFQEQVLQTLEQVQVSVLPEATEITEKVRHIAQWIAEHFGELNRQQIEAIGAAARIALIGKIFLPDELLHQPPTVNGIATHQLMHQIPYCSDKILEPIPFLHPIRTILHSLFENYDGTGFPDRIEKGLIPIESRILRIAYDFQMYRYAFSLSPLEAMEKMQRDTKKAYDPRLVMLLDEYIWTNLRQDLQGHIQVISLADLREGMILARDLITNAGMKLAASGTVLTAKAIEHIQNHVVHDPLIGSIYIRTS